MKQRERLISAARLPKRIWDVVCQGRYDFLYDLMPVQARNMSLKKRLNLFRAGANILYRRTTPWSLPIHMQIELTNFCSLRCPVCPAGRGALRRSPLAMEAELLERLMEEVGPYLLTVSLWGWGESLLHPRVAEMLRIVRRYPVVSILSTNGQPLDRDEVIDALITHPPEYLIVGIDGLTDETNSKYRVGAKLDPILEGVRRLAELKRKRNQKHPVLHMRYIVMNHNEHEVPRLKEFAVNHDFDMLTIRTLSRTDIPEDEYRYYMPRSDNYAAYRYTEGKRLERDDFICTEPFWFPTMFADGTVVTCSQDYNAEMPIGVLRKGSSFRELWNGSHAASLRRIIRDSRVSAGFCAHCPLCDRTANDPSIVAYELDGAVPRINSTHEERTVW